MTDLPAQITSKIEVDERTQCWMWTAATDPRGYGRINWQGRTQFAHRVVYALLKNPDIGGLEIDHLCRAHGCVNPEHLEAVTHEENVRRGINGVLSSARYANHLYCPQGHPLFGDNLYLHIVKNGTKNKQCRTCRAASDRRRRARLRGISRARVALAAAPAEPPAPTESDPGRTWSPSWPASL